MNDIERLARAIWEARPDTKGEWPLTSEKQRRAYPHNPIASVDLSFQYARVVLKELREPSNIMLNAGEETFIASYTGTPTTTPDRVFQAMIDAILEEEGTN